MMKAWTIFWFALFCLQNTKDVFLSIHTMKMRKHFSMISIIIALFLIAIKAFLDIKSYYSLVQTLDVSQSEVIEPTVLAIGVNINLIYIALIIAGLFLAFLGCFYKNKFCILSVALNLFATAYSMASGFILLYFYPWLA